MFLPSSIMGERQYAQETLHGRWWVVDFAEGSYQPKSWWPFVKLMSDLWNMAAHWNGDCARRSVWVDCVACGIDDLEAYPV
jgi:hypothetical protein